VGGQFHAVDEARELLADGESVDEVDSTGATALFWALNFAQYDSLSEDPKPLHEMIGLLLKEPASINHRNVYGRIALFAATQSKKLSTAELLLDWNADGEVADLKGETPIFVAARRNDLEMMKLLTRKVSRPLGEIAGIDQLIAVAIAAESVDALNSILDNTTKLRA